MSASRTLTTLALLATLLASALLAVFGCGGGGGGGSSVTSPTPPDTTGTPPDSSVTPPPTFNFSFPGHGVSKTYTFNSAGDWGYFCLKHGTQGMLGTVHVRESSLRDSALIQVGAGPTEQRYAPDTVTVKVGGKVRWVNVSTDPDHTATRL
jgi:plastocyanin